MAKGMMGELSTHFTCEPETPPTPEAPPTGSPVSNHSSVHGKPCLSEVLLLTAPSSLPCISPSQVAQDQALRQGAACQQEQERELCEGEGGVCGRGQGWR